MSGITPSRPEDLGADIARRAVPALRDWLLAGALAAAFTLSVVDRYVLAYLVADIESDLNLTDLQIGILQGFAFSLIFGVAGLPLGHLVDRISRIRLVMSAIAVWSAMTVCCGLARNYATLALGRSGVGMGEAAVTPASFSMLSDVFPPRYFFVASAIFSIGPVLAVSVAGALSALVLRQANAAGLIVSAWFGEIAAWRVVFILCGLSSVPLILGLSCLREPARSGAPNIALPAISFGDFLRFARSNWRVHLAYCVASGLTTAASYALNAWMPATLLRDFGWTQDGLGSILASIALVSGLIGCAVAGGVSTMLVARKNTRGLFTTVSIAAATFALVGLLIPAMRGGTGALAVLATAYVMSPLLFVLAPSLLQILTPPRFRGRMSAMFLLMNVGIGAGLGPALVGALSSIGHQPLATALGVTIFSLCALASMIALQGRARFADFADQLAIADRQSPTFTL